MKVGDLVRVVSSDEPFNLRPGEGSIGMIVDIAIHNRTQTSYFVYINDVAWRYNKDELELISNGSR